MCNCQQNNCGCSETTVSYNHCHECPPEPCDCAVKDLSTDCIILTIPDSLTCSGIEPGTILTEAIQQLDEYICTAIGQVNASINIVNVGTGAEIYKGIDGIGRRELKTITSDGSVTIVENADNIELSVDTTPSLQDIDSVLAEGDTATDKELTMRASTGSKQSVLSADNMTVNSPGKVASVNSESVIFVEGDRQTTYYNDLIEVYKTSTSQYYRIGLPLPTTSGVIVNFPNDLATGVYNVAMRSEIPTIDGSETKITNGTNTTVTGNGTIATPYQIAVPTPTGSETKVNAGTNISVTGTGTTGSPYVVTNTLVVDGSETKISNGATTAVTGTGTTGSPYVVETVNLQKPITADYLITAADNNYSIKVNNGATPITITVPIGLPENFFAGFTQKGTADVTFVGSGGASITNPVGLKIKGQGFCVGLEQIGVSNTFDLTADTKA